MAAYLILYLKYIKKIPGEWEDYWPQAIPIATAFAVGSLLACVATTRRPARVYAPHAALVWPRTPRWCGLVVRSWHPRRPSRLPQLCDCILAYLGLFDDSRYLCPLPWGSQPCALCAPLRPFLLMPWRNPPYTRPLMRTRPPSRGRTVRKGSKATGILVSNTCALPLGAAKCHRCSTCMPIGAARTGRGVFTGSTDTGFRVRSVP